MAKHPHINKRILRLEYRHIAPAEYIPDFETQLRLNPGAITELVYEYVSADIEREGFIIPINHNDKAKSIKIESVYRVLLTQAVFRQIHRLPPAKKAVVLEFDAFIHDPENQIDILEDCIEKAEDTLNSQLFSKKIVDRVWNRIKCAYGSKHSPPNEEIFKNFALVETETEILV